MLTCCQSKLRCGTLCVGSLSLPGSSDNTWQSQFRLTDTQIETPKRRYLLLCAVFLGCHSDLCNWYASFISCVWLLFVDTRDLAGSLLYQRDCEFGAAGGRGGRFLPLFSIHGNVVPPGRHPFRRHEVIKAERKQKKTTQRGYEKLKWISMEGEADKEESTTGYKERGKWEVYCGAGCEITSISWIKRQFLCNWKGCDASYPPANTCKDHQYERAAPTLAE